jgi:RHS repeat-associated protein
VTYPSRFAVKYGYTSLGYVANLTDAASNQPYWTANARDAEMHLIQDTAGNGVKTNRTFDLPTGRLLSIGAGIPGNGNNIANFTYAYDPLGNLHQRQDTNSGNLTETFSYDALNRLIQASRSVNPTLLSYTYDSVGNLLSKSDVGNYTYPPFGSAQPHAVSSIGGGAVTTTFTYDGNGNQTDGLGRHIDYASYNKPARITQGALSLTFADDVDHQRFQLSTYNGSTLASTTTYFDAFGVHAELFTAATTQWTDYLMVAGSMVGMRVLHADQSVQVRYFHQDHLGSIAAVSDESGASAVERNAYDPWGREQSSSGTASQTIRGYTGQELLASVGLVHLNGRVYDPVIGRMMSADPVVGDPLNGQTWNRYSYVNNNPLAYTDPTGYCAVCGVVDSAGTFLRHSFGWIKRTLLRNPIIGSLYVIASATACGPLGPVCAAVATAEIAGITTGDFGLALRAGAIAGATALAFYGVGEITSGMPGAIPIDGTHGTFIPFSEGHIANIVGHALVGCGSAVASGGKCGPGALAAAVPAFAGPFLMGFGRTGRLLVSTTLGGLGSVAGGGKFANGAVTGAFGYLFNGEGIPLKWGLGIVGAGIELIDALTPTPGNDNESPLLPEYVNGGKTTGVLRTDASGTNDVAFQSGVDGPARSMPKGAPGYDLMTRTHVEGHAAAWMTQNGLSDATLYINNPKICDSCQTFLPRMLPPGANLTVVLPSGVRAVFTGIERW